MLAQLDALLTRAIDRVRELGAPEPGADPFRGLYLAHDDVARSLSSEAGAPFGLSDPLHPHGAGRFAAVVSAFALSGFEADLLAVALAPEVDLRYERIYAYLQDDVTRRRPTVDLALSLLCRTAQEKLVRRVHLAPHAPLLRFGLLEVPASSPAQPLLARPLVVDEQVVGALLGAAGIDRRCAAYTSLSRPRATLDELLIDQQTRGTIADAVVHARDAGQPLRLALHGRARSGSHAIAEAVAGTLSVPLVAVDVHALLGEENVRRAFRLVFRERWLRGAVLLLDRVDALNGREHEDTCAVLTRELASDGGVVVLSSLEPWRSALGRAPDEVVGLVSVSLPPLDDASRRTVWQQAGVDLTADELDALADRFVLEEAQIREAVASVRAAGQTTSRAALFAAARVQSAGELENLASKIAPRASWGDLVLPVESIDQLRELSSWVTHRRRVLGDWGFGRRLSRGRGATALFAGAAGTGKTLAAEVLAGELGLDLYRIELAGIVSKYIGETEKNLDRIFRAAQDSNAVLFFDEADALFGKRSEVRDSHDRYANIEISYLLQRMETYEGVAILATNLRDNLDQAFVRRLAFIVTFPFPEEDERRRIWEIVWPAQAPLDDGLDLDSLAAAHRLSGGQIKNVALAAAYLAAADGGVIGSEQVDSALRREYEKSGRGSRPLEVAV